ncbi:MAG: class I SAM-dependent methyltransferase [Planctomycetes bacterium]|nr:class I SAM-dependent methyltransferase [Planctomycetota bacterium]
MDEAPPPSLLGALRSGTPEIRAVREAYNARHRAGVIRDSDRFYRWIARRVAAGVAPERRGLALCLDSGCGGGYFLREAALAAPGAFRGLHGLEVSDVALAEARRQAPGARLVLGQGERLPYPAGLFDAVVCLGNLEHFLDPAAGAREIARVLRPGGRAWVLLPNSFYSGDLWRVVWRGYGPDHHQPVERFATVNEWRDFLEACGLAVEGVEPYNRFKWWKRLLPRNLAYHFLYRARAARLR